MGHHQGLLESLLKNHGPQACEVFSNYFHSRAIISHIFLDRIQLVYISPLDLTIKLEMCLQSKNVGVEKNRKWPP